MDNSINGCSQFLRAYSLGKSGFSLAWILEELEKLGCDFKHNHFGTSIDNAFFKELRNVARMDVLREIKHSARIPVPESYLLVGVADEGPVYRNAGRENVYILPEGHIYGMRCRSFDCTCWLNSTPSLRSAKTRWRAHLVGRCLYYIAESSRASWRWWMFSVVSIQLRSSTLHFFNSSTSARNWQTSYRYAVPIWTLEECCCASQCWWGRISVIIPSWADRVNTGSHSLSSCLGGWYLDRDLI